MSNLLFLFFVWLPINEYFLFYSIVFRFCDLQRLFIGVSHKDYRDIQYLFIRIVLVLNTFI